MSEQASWFSTTTLAKWKRWQLGHPVTVVTCSIIALAGCPLEPAEAQLLTDNTLGTEGSAVISIDPLNDKITGGAQRGSNLFHSFNEFNVGEGRGVFFANPTGIENILSRVTGQSPSHILGQLGVLGPANLFLVNPNGIIFGDNSRLDIQGSFFSTTASAIDLSGQGFFSATDPHQSRLLSVSPSTLFFNQVIAQAGSIINKGELSVGAGQSLGLVSHQILHVGSLDAPSGLVFLLGQHISLQNQAHIDVSGSIAGGTVLVGRTIQNHDISHNTKRIFIGPDVVINASALTHGDGGEVVIAAHEATGLYGDINARSGSHAGDGGFVAISGQKHLLFRGHVDTSTTNGTPGQLSIATENITIADGAKDLTFDEIDSLGVNLPNQMKLILDTPIDEFKNKDLPTIFEIDLENILGNINLSVQATNDILIEDFQDNELIFNPGNSFIEFIADVDQNGIGSFIMQDHSLDTIVTSGRDISISGSNLVIGNINTSLVEFQGDRIAIDIDSGGSIPATGSRGTAIFTFTVPDLGQNIEDLDIRFSANHAFIPDITEVVLESPLGTSLLLFESIEDDNNNFNDTIFDDDAPISINAGAAPFRGRYRPLGNGGLAIFRGQDPTGIWTLTVKDQFDFNSGTLFRVNDLAPFGIALGTQLIFQDAEGSTLGSGISGAIHLSATNGNIYLDTLETSNRFSNGGDIVLNATGDITTNGALSSDAFSDLGNSGRGGNISISSTSGNIFTNRALLSSSGDSGQAGNITISSTSGNIFTNRLLFASSGDSGQAGNISISSTAGNIFTNRALLSDASDSGRGGSLSIPGNPGQGGDISISSLFGDITLNRTVFTPSFSDSVNSGQGGDIFISAPSGKITINREIGSFSFSGMGNSGQAGDITLLAKEIISDRNAQLFSFSVAQKGGESGIGGTVTISADVISDLRVFTLSSAEQAGRIQISNLDKNLTIRNLSLTTSGLVEILDPTNPADLIAEISNEFGQASDTSIVSSGDLILEDSVIQSDSNNSDIAGTTLIKSEGEILFTNSQINSNANNTGRAGDIEIVAKGGITITGENSGIFARTLNEGQGGSIQTSSETLTITEQADISASSLGSGEAGNIMLSIDGLFTSIDSQISTTTNQSSGGTITISAKDIKLNNSDIQTNVANGSGGGGNIFLRANSILAVGDSDILAFSQDGIGGNITLDSPIFIGENFAFISDSMAPDQLDGNGIANINATGTLASGTVALPDNSFIEESLAALPQEPVDPNALIANSCIVRTQAQQGTFVVTGAGGFAQRPSDAAIGSYSTGTVKVIPSQVPAALRTSSRPWEIGDPIIEPQNVYRLPKGQLVISRDCPQ